MSKYILSVIIPTRNRQYYCLKAVEQILSHNWKHVEVCIQDNSDNNTLEKDLSLINSENITYRYHRGVLSFVDNFSEAVSLAHGKYLCMIGDDDGILPDILNLIDDMETQCVDAAIPGLNFVYFWPSNLDIVTNGETGVLISHLSSEIRRRECKTVRCEDAVTRLLSRAVQNYTDLDMPRLYHGVVRREVLEKIKDTVGFYFGGLTPDMYMATALSLVCKKVIRINYSITISGICPTSGSSDSAIGKHTGSLSDAPHFRGHENYEWENLVPAFYSVDTIWADTLFHALKDFKREDMVKHFNQHLFAAICIHKYPEYKEIVLAHAIENNCTALSIKREYCCYQVRVLIKRVFNKVKRMLLNRTKKDMIKEYDLPDIISAEKRIAEYNQAIK